MMDIIKSLICPYCGSDKIKISAGINDALLLCLDCGNEGKMIYTK